MPSLKEGELMKEKEMSPGGDKRSRVCCDLEIKGRENLKKRAWSVVSLLREDKMRKHRGQAKDLFG